MGIRRLIRAALWSAACSSVLPGAFAAGDASAVQNQTAVTMQRFMVSATRIDRNPWRYAGVPGFEVLTRASDNDTDWWLDSIRRGMAIETQVMPKEWLPDSPVANTVIIDDTDLEAVPVRSPRSQPIVFQAPGDAATWGPFAAKVTVWSDRFEARDEDTYAINSNVFGADTHTPACVIGTARLFRCAPPLPRWLMEGLLGRRCGLFRESFMPVVNMHEEGWIRNAEGPGTLWVSLGESQRLLAEFKRDRKAVVAVPPLESLFAETPAAPGSAALWESEAGLFVRWGLVGPGRKDTALWHAFQALVERARREPVTEGVFTECFGFGYGVMEGRLASFLKSVLLQPTDVDVNISPQFPEAGLRPATADQIGRILGDWLRMQGISLRKENPEMSAEFLGAAGRMLERAYRDDNGLPPDVSPAGAGGRTAQEFRTPEKTSIVMMKPFAVSSSKIHDPRLLAVYGLYEHDFGNPAKAAEFLEAAARQDVVRPRASTVLATLRYDDALATPQGGGGTLGAQQVASVLEPLHTALRYPPSAEAYRLLVLAWEHSEARPATEDIKAMTAGVALYPRYTSLAYHAARVCARGGYLAEARDLISRGERFAGRGNGMADFERLRSTLPTPAAP